MQGCKGVYSRRSSSGIRPDVQPERERKALVEGRLRSCQTSRPFSHQHALCCTCKTTLESTTDRVRRHVELVLTSFYASELVRLLKHKKPQQGKAHGISPTQPTEDGRRTPAPWDTVNVHCEVSFTHTINPLLIISKKKSKKQNVQVSGRVDHGVGIVTWSQNIPNRRFHSLLLCIEEAAFSTH
ncbi:hypothetical protein M378DRAFT_154713 [Amanita muscaria Koide BX008]|uniref:Uncharacterized protein n=1 Tax=Amanita muscaria (strain Koide BX008) TaxID=946122 RepID=A0A0C2XNP7_AMAMK|nr:hypothetical protein M378DRAFT_154713 [Amanita muscaria Koide BX008]